MDDKTVDYRERQFKRLSTSKQWYPTKLKIKQIDAETFWLNINEVELEQIRLILTKERKG